MYLLIVTTVIIHVYYFAPYALIYQYLTCIKTKRLFLSLTNNSYIYYYTYMRKLDKRPFWGFILLILLLFTNQQNGLGQEMLGLTLGNYSGSPGLMINPAMITNNKSFLDINLVSADVFFRNSFAYIPKDDFVIWDAFKKDYILPTYTANGKNFLYYENQDLKSTTVNVRLMGPSVMLQVGKHGFGLQTGVRFFSSGNRIPWEIPVFGYQGLDYGKLQNINFIDYDFDFSSTAWMEVGLSYGYDVYDYSDEKITLGISVKKLWGYSGVYAQTQNGNYIVLDDSTISIKDFNTQIGFAAPNDNTQEGFNQTGPTFKGSGIGLDIGVVYIKKKKFGSNVWRGGKLCSQTYDDYQYRLGISILDIGRINYKSNTQLHSFNDIEVYWARVDTLKYNNTNQFVADLSTIMYGDPNASLSGDKIKIGLPTALSIQFDYHLNQRIYLAGFFIHPIRFNQSALRRPAQLAFVPRFETRFLDISVPFSLYEYQYPRVGLAARFYFLTIGTERLGTYLGMADMNGLDIYASIKISINKGSCRSRFGGACSNANFGNKKLGM